MKIDKKIIFILFTVFSVLIRGYSFGIQGHYFQIPMVYKINNPALYPSDFLFSFNFPNSTPLYIISFLIEYIEIEILYLILYLCCSFIYIYAVYKLSKLIFNNEIIAYLSIFFLIIPKISIGGGDQTFYTFFQYNSITIPLLLLSLYNFLKKRTILSHIIASLMIYFHPLSSINILGIYFFIHIYKLFKIILNRIRKKSSLIKHIKKNIFLLFLTLLLITPYFIFVGDYDISIISQDKDWIEIVKLRNGSHLFPLNYPFSFLHSLPYLVLSLIGVLYLMEKKEYKYKLKIHNNILLFCIGIIFYLIIASIFTEIIPLQIIIWLQFFRFTIFLQILAIIYSSYFIYKLILTDNNKLLIAGAITGLFNFDVYFLLIFFPLLMIQLKILKRFEKYIRIMFYIGLSIGILFTINSFYNLTFLPKSAILQYETLFTFTLVSLTLLMLPRITRKKNILKSLRTPFVVLSLGMFFIGGLGDSDLTFNIEKHIDIPNIMLKHDDWIDMQLWVHESLDKNKSIIVPPYVADSRSYSKISTFGSWRDGGLSPYSKEFAFEWRKRMKMIKSYTSDHNEIMQGYNQLSEPEINKIASEYKQDYIIFENNKMVSYPVIYQNKKYSLYKIE